MAINLNGFDPFPQPAPYPTLAGPDDEEEGGCNGICLTPADIGLPEYGGPGVVAYPHPNCPEHGDPQEEDSDAGICGRGDESQRYVRADDMEGGEINGEQEK